jgi:hypothetical protein
MSQVYTWNISVDILYLLIQKTGFNNNEISKSEQAYVAIPESILETVVVSPANNVRSLAFSLITSSASTTRPYSRTALCLLKHHLGSYFAVSDVKFRMEIQGKCKDMYRRLRGAILLLQKSLIRSKNYHKPNAKETIEPINSTTEDSSENKPKYRSNILSMASIQLQDALSQHEEFLHWYLEFLKGELIPTAAYQRHITSLRTISTILRLEGDSQKIWASTSEGSLFYERFDHGWIRLLLDLISDPFEDVRDASVGILKTFFTHARFCRIHDPDAASKLTITEIISEFLTRSNDLSLRTARADHADSVARANELLITFLPTPELRLSLLAEIIQKLEAKLLLAETDLGRAALEAPIQGDFSALRCSYIPLKL